MGKKLEDFTVRVNLDGWHIRGHGTCWQGQEFQGAGILPRMVTAIEENERFRFQGTMAPVCTLRGGSIEDLKLLLKGIDPDSVKKSSKKKKSSKIEKIEVEEEREEEEENEEEENEEDKESEEEDEEEDDDDDEEDDEENPLDSSKKKRSPRARKQ